MVGEASPHRQAVFEYYLLDGDELARVRYDADSGEYVDGQLLDEYGEWSDYPLNDILMDGVEITEDEAEDLASERGATLEQD